MAILLTYLLLRLYFDIIVDSSYGNRNLFNYNLVPYTVDVT